jgi:hypothetical protein
MPPVAKAGGTQFRKDVAFAETKDSDEYELEATGIVMVPDKADLQNDFAREDTIRSFAEQFETFVEADQAGGGIMHAVWPDGWMALERNEVLDEAEEINGETVDAGAWVQRWGIDNAELAALIDDNIFEGYSIGAIQVDWDGPFEPDEVDDVDTSEIPDDELVWELIEGIIREVSTVDIPAVPDAQILEAKADAEKRLAEHIGNPDAFLEEAMERGHSEEEAQRMWDLLNEAMEADGAGEPGKQSALSRAGKAFLSALTPGSDDGSKSEAPGLLHRSEVSETPDEDPRASAKEGRTLSTANRESVMAQIDAGLDVLQDAGVEDLPKRFTDREDVDFDLSEHDARDWSGDHDEDEEDGSPFDPETATANDATGGDTPDDGGSDAADTTMTDDDTTDDPMDDAPEWASALQDSIEENSKRIEEVAGDGDADADGDKDADADGPWADAPEWAKALKESTEQNAERIDTIAQQSGHSQQLEASGDGDGTEESGLDGVGKALS